MARYADLSREELVARLAAYEKNGPAPPSPPPPPESEQRPFQFASHPTRHIAIMVSYQGWPYTGLALQPTTPYPTVEGELMKALEKTRLIAEGGGWESCGFGRCGRTDRGVSGEGQVLNLWVRSQRNPDDGGHDMGDTWRAATETKEDRHAIWDTDSQAGGAEGQGKEIEAPTSEATKPKPKIEKIETQAQVEKRLAKPRPPPLEINYPRLLNSVLPDAIRVLAWTPAPVDFDSRFSCQHRHYKYMFHLHATPGHPELDLDLMRAGAERLIGTHDFRNFCRLDGSKQIENHSRRVMLAWFEPTGAPDQWVFNLIGTAFLWHQVRHIIAVLFLIGTRAEKPELVTELLDVEKLPAKPVYKMGAPLPLTLHECAYRPECGLDWRFGPYDGPWTSLQGDEREAARPHADGGREKLERDLDGMRQEAEVRAWQVSGALRRIRDIFPEPPYKQQTATLYPIGAGERVMVKNYTPVMRRSVGDTPDVVNEKWRNQRGKRRAELREAKDAEAAKTKEATDA